MFRSMMVAGAMLLLGVGSVYAATATPLTKDAQIQAGKKIFNANCAACHQPNGQGMPGMFPPLAKSDYVAKLLKEGNGNLIDVPLKGHNGSLTVNGQDYNGSMPSMSQLSDQDLANTLTYVVNSWGNPGGQISKNDVTKARAALH